MCGQPTSARILDDMAAGFDEAFDGLLEDTDSGLRIQLDQDAENDSGALHIVPLPKREVVELETQLTAIAHSLSMLRDAWHDIPEDFFELLDGTARTATRWALRLADALEPEQKDPEP